MALLVRHITGHNFLRYHRSVIDPTIDPTCRECGAANEESAHLVFDCCPLLNLRVACFDHHLLDDSWTIQQLLIFLSDDRIRNLELDDPDPDDTT